jgi:hypothetical protein
MPPNELTGSRDGFAALCEPAIPHRPSVNHPRPDFERHGDIGRTSFFGKARRVG